MLILLLCAFHLASGLPLDQELHASDVCGYASCPVLNSDVLNVHIVPHTHDDVGWLKTVDQYYYGSRNNIQKAGVQYILDSVIKELWDNPARRFIYVETFFFWKWWVRQPESIQTKVRTLVSQGRLQFVGGAWSMNDEAASHYQSTVDQFTWGLRKLNETFGKCGMPRVGWQIDPFGHSREFASLLAAMGYHGLFLGRIDYQDKGARLKSKTMETVWRGDDDLGKSSDIFTGVLFNTYSPPPGFCFDVLCSDVPIIDDVNSPEYNVESRVSEFLEVCKNMSKGYATRNVLVTMGEDFQYQDAAMWFVNLDKLIEYTNLKAAKENIPIKLFYSTPDCYLKAVKEANPTLPIKQDDFFPYASDPTAYWTGYFTSRPTTKYFEREGNAYLQMAKQLQVLGDVKESNIYVLNELKGAMGIMQHHDAITGTEKQHVTHDYERILHQAIEDSLVIPRETYTKLMQTDKEKPPLFEFNRCRLNESSCPTSESNDKFVVTVYNPLAWAVNASIRIPVRSGMFSVYAPNGDKIDSQLVDIPLTVINIPTRTSNATHEIVFIAYLHPLSYKSFYVTKETQAAKKIVRREAFIYNPKNDFLANNFNDYLKQETQEAELKEKNLLYHKYSENWDYDGTDKDSVFSPDVQQLKKVITEAKADDKINALNKVDVPEEIECFVLESYVINTSSWINNMNSDNYQTTYVPDVTPDMELMGDDPSVVTSYPEEQFMENEHIQLRYNESSGQFVQVILSDSTELRWNAKFYFYAGADNKKRASGAYILRPKENTPIEAEIRYYKGPIGPVVKELRSISPDNVASTIRLYKDLNFIENDWVIGPIDIQDKIGKEYIVRYISDIWNEGEFYTDSNGRQMLKRKLNQRPQWNVSLQEPIPGNYYPVTNKISIQDSRVKMSVLTDRSEGGTSLDEGQIELMLHRRLLFDDGFGVAEPLNENAKGKGLIARGTQRLYFSKVDDKNANINEKKHVLEFHLRPLVLVSSTTLDVKEWLQLKNGHSWTNPLPLGLHLLTLEPWGKNKLLLRLENYLELSDIENSTIEIDLRKIFKTITLTSLRETTLAANQWIDEEEHWEWNTSGSFVKNFNEAYCRPSWEAAPEILKHTDKSLFNVVIRAKEIRTFIVDYRYN